MVSEVSRFFGVVVAMHYNEHEPPHFHARYAERKATIAIESLQILEGSLPSRVLGSCWSGPRCIGKSSRAIGNSRVPNNRYYP